MSVIDAGTPALMGSLDVEAVRVELVVVVAGDDESEGLADRQVDLGRRRRDGRPLTVMSMVRPDEVGDVVEVVADADVPLVVDDAEVVAELDEVDGVAGVGVPPEHAASATAAAATTAAVKRRRIPSAPFVVRPLRD